MDEFQFLKKAFFRLSDAERLDALLKEHVATLPKKQQFLTDNHSISIKRMIIDYLEMRNEKTRGRG